MGEWIPIWLIFAIRTFFNWKNICGIKSNISLVSSRWQSHRNSRTKIWEILISSAFDHNLRHIYGWRNLKRCIPVDLIGACIDRALIVHQLIASIQISIVKAPLIVDKESSSQIDIVGGSPRTKTSRQHNILARNELAKVLITIDAIKCDEAGEWISSRSTWYAWKQ